MNRKQLRSPRRPQFQRRKPNLPRAETITETIEELRFYLAHSMADQARVVFAKLEKLKPGAAQLAAVWQEIEAAEAQVGASSPKRRRSFRRRSGRGSLRAGNRERVCRKIQPATEREFVPDPIPAPAEEFKLPVRPIVPAPEPAVAEYAEASPEAAPAGVLGEFVSDLEASLGDGFLPPPPPAPPPSVQPRAARESIAANSAHAAAAAAPAPIPAPAPRHGSSRRRLSPISQPRSGRWLPKSRPQLRKRTPPAWIWRTCSAS